MLIKTILRCCCFHHKISNLKPGNMTESEYWLLDVSILDCDVWIWGYISSLLLTDRGRPFSKHMRTWNILQWWRGCWDLCPNIWCWELSKIEFVGCSFFVHSFTASTLAIFLHLFWSLCSRRAEKYFRRGARLDWPEGATSRESMRAVWKLPRLQVIVLCKLYLIILFVESNV